MHRAVRTERRSESFLLTYLGKKKQIEKDKEGERENVNDNDNGIIRDQSVDSYLTWGWVGGWVSGWW